MVVPLPRWRAGARPTGHPEPGPRTCPQRAGDPVAGRPCLGMGWGCTHRPCLGDHSTTRGKPSPRSSGGWGVSSSGEGLPPPPSVDRAAEPGARQAPVGGREPACTRTRLGHRRAGTRQGAAWPSAPLWGGDPPQNRAGGGRGVQGMEGGSLTFKKSYKKLLQNLCTVSFVFGGDGGGGREGAPDSKTLPLAFASTAARPPPPQGPPARAPRPGCQQIREGKRIFLAGAPGSRQPPGHLSFLSPPAGAAIPLATLSPQPPRVNSTPRCCTREGAPLPVL